MFCAVARLSVTFHAICPVPAVPAARDVTPAIFSAPTGLSAGCEVFVQRPFVFEFSCLTPTSPYFVDFAVADGASWIFLLWV